MRFDRKFYMVAMVILAVFLFATNVCAATITFSVTDVTGGTITPTGSGNINPSGGYVATGDDPHPFVMAPESNYQIVAVIVSEGKNKTYHVLPDCNDNDDGKNCSTVGGVATYEFIGPQNDWTIEVTFAAIPVVASFVTEQPSGSEAGISVQFTDTSEYIDSNATQNTWNWDFGDGNTSTLQNPVHTFGVGTYDVTLTVTNETTQTSDSYTLAYIAIQPTITYNASAGANGFITGPDNIITPSEESHDYTVDEGLTTTFTITPDTHYQIADVLVDGISQGPVPSVTFNSDNIADHTITASFEPIPVIASFSSDLASGDITTLDSVQFTDTSVNGASSWLWNFGDGSPVSTEQNPVHTFADAGTFTVTLTVDNALTSDIVSAAYTVESSYLSSPVMQESTSHGYFSLQSAYEDIAVLVETIKMKAGELPLEDIFIDKIDVSVLIEGGYDDTFENVVDYTIINGNVTITFGNVTMSNVIIAPAI